MRARMCSPGRKAVWGLQQPGIHGRVCGMEKEQQVVKRGARRGVTLFVLLGLIMGVPITLHAQRDARSGLADAAETGVDVPIEVDADVLDYDRENERITASGNVHIVSGSDHLRADRVLVHVATGDAYALGNVELIRAGQPIRGDRLHYNFKTRISSLDRPEVEADPFKVIADNVTRAPDNTYILKKAKLTTCMYDHDHAHYHIRARRLTVVPNEYLVARHATWYFGKVPVFYVPYWKRRLHDEYGWTFYPGYRSRWGGYLLSSFFHRPAPGLRLEHHVDLYSERGVGLGEDVDWRTEGGKGQLSLYFIDDNTPLGDTPPLDAEEIDASRYRITLRHDQTFSDRTQLFVRNEYVSDIDFRRDFFENEFQQLRQPENYLALSHREDLFTLSGRVNYRVHDFYPSVNRLPEISLDWYRMQLGDTSFYYESQSSVAYLEREFAERDNQDAFSSFRLDTEHTLYQPRRVAGWLNVVPRAGYRGTYYSASRDAQTTTEVTTTTVTNELTLVEETRFETNQVTTVTDGGARFRNAFEIGTEVSFKAFKRLPDSADGQPWRHVVEPYVNYSLRFEPTVLPDELYDFDAVDQLDELHTARLGIRNLLQTKWQGRSVEAADLNIFTTARLNATGDESVFRDIQLDSRFRPNKWVQIDMDGVYDLDASLLSEFNTRMRFDQEESWRFQFEHRYRDSTSNLLLADATFSPNTFWDLNVFGRYEFERSRLEEQGAYVQRNFDCMSVRLGGSFLPGFTRTDGTEQDDDYRVLLAFWLTAFPDMGLNAYGR